MEYINLTSMPAYSKLEAGEQVSIRELLSKERIEKSNIKLGGGLMYN